MHMSLNLLRRLPLHVVSLLIPSLLTAQVFIPDPVLRDSLNAQVPGIVDGGGMLDELHPGIGAIDTLVLWHTSSPTLLDLSGLEHLPSLRHLYVTVLDELQQIEEFRIPALPSGVKSLEVNTHHTGHLRIGALPDTMDYIMVGCFDGSDVPGSIVVFDDLPVYSGYLGVAGVQSMTWPGIANCGEFRIGHYDWTVPRSKLTASSVTTALLTVFNANFDSLDLSRVNTTRVSFENTEVGQWIAWPPAATNLTFVHYSIHEGVPSLPAQLDTLEGPISEFCLPYLPNTLRHLVWGEACLPNWPDSLDIASLGEGTYTESTAPYCSILNSVCPGAYPSIAGSVFHDVDGNSVHDPDEAALPQTHVMLQPSGSMASCQPDGTWEIGVPPGNYTITVASNYPYIQSMEPGEHSADVPNLGEVDTDNHFAIMVPYLHDLRVHLTASPSRPGFDNSVYLRCENYGTTPADAEVTFTFDADQTWLGSSVAPTSTSSNTATWNFPAMPIGAVQHIVVDLNTATTVALGTHITHTLTADPITADETPLNNSYTFNGSVVGSYDPNDKLLSPAVLTPAEVALGETPIEYTIRFQNTGTSLAERVVILDTLSTDLQWESMRFIASSHDQHWYIVDGVLHVIHNDIMLPDSNSNEAASHGFFKFSMLPKTDLVNGSTIENIAHIVFDFNAPIVTPSAVFMVDIAAGLDEASTRDGTYVIPNPAQDRIQVHAGDMNLLRYRIIDVLGAQVQTGALVPGDWLVVERLIPGAYMMVLDNGDTHTIRRFIKR
jgi:uncharacterized repeat protein (TIGR01451 family)